MRGGARYRIEKGWLEGQFPSEGEGAVLACNCPQLVIPAFRFGVERGTKLRALGGLEKSLTNRAVAAHAPVFPLTCGRFVVVARTFRGRKIGECVAMATAGQKAANEQPRTDELHRELEDVALRGPGSREMRGIAPQTQPFGPTAAAFYYNVVSRVLATFAARWPGVGPLSLP